MNIITVTLHPALDKIIRIPHLRPNEISRAVIESLYAGGKGNNVARALHRLGAPVIATGYQGGNIGDFVIQTMKDEGIPTDFVSCSQPTRTSLLIIENDTGYTYPIYEPGQSVTGSEILSLKEKFTKLIQQAAVCLFCGSAQSQPLADLLAELVTLANEQGVKTVLDASGLALKTAMPRKPYMVKVNREELAEFFGSQIEDREIERQALAKLTATGISIVAMSKGAEGIILTDGAQFIEGKLPMQNVINVMGCGDSLLAGMVVSMFQGGDLANMVRWGVAAGAANTQKIGAGYIDREIVESYLADVRIQIRNK